MESNGTAGNIEKACTDRSYISVGNICPDSIACPNTAGINNACENNAAEDIAAKDTTEKHIRKSKSKKDRCIEGKPAECKCIEGKPAECKCIEGELAENKCIGGKTVKSKCIERKRIKRKCVEGKCIKGISSDNMLHGELPYEKFLRLGAGALTEPELLAIIIRTGTSARPAVEIGKEILELPSVKEDGLNGLHHVTVKELTGIKGIGEVKAVKIKCIAELSMRMAMMTAKKDLQFLNPSTVAGYYMERMRHEQKERVLLLMLDTRNCLIGEEILSIGTVKVSLLSPREVFVAALKVQAVHIMLLHNHPSGDPSPSREDIGVTEDIKQIGRMIDIPLIDHIIIGDNRYMSFKEAGLL